MAEKAQSRIVRYVFNYNLLEGISIVVSTSILLAGMVRCSRARARVCVCACGGAAVWCCLSPTSRHVVSSSQVFSSNALSHGSFGYWVLIVFVGSVISLSLFVMTAIIVFESYRALKFSALYEFARYGSCVVLFSFSVRGRGRLCGGLATCCGAAHAWTRSDPDAVACVARRRGCGSDFAERKMVKRINTSAEGSTAMQIGFSSSIGGPRGRVSASLP